MPPERSDGAVGGLARDGDSSSDSQTCEHGIDQRADWQKAADAGEGSRQINYAPVPLTALRGVDEAARYPKAARLDAAIGQGVTIAPSRDDKDPLGRGTAVILPALGLIRPAIIISSVLLPQPEGPSTLTNSPAVRAKLASRIASISP
jgi:hypothetical protein